MKKFLYLGILIVLLSLNVKAQKFGNALQFDGVNDYVDLGNASTFDVGTAVTYEAWIYPESTQSGFIMNKWVGFAEDKQLIVGGNQLYFYLYDVFNWAQLVSSPSSIPLHQYTHVAATYNASTGTATLFINGVFDTSKSVGNNVSNSTGNLYIGCNAVRYGNELPFKGIVDEIRIWDVARTESEIQSTMNQPLNGNEPGLIGYWEFDEGTGTITYDATSNHNDGTIHEAAWVVPSEVELLNDKIPGSFALDQNYPNPFNPSTKISWRSPVSSWQTLKVYDVLGNEVVTLVDEYKAAGSYEVELDAYKLSSGIYFYRLQAENFLKTMKMVLLK
jgi:hypothetical protein